MRPVPPTAARTRRFLRVPTAARLSGRTAVAALVAALVVGILGMHALASHGAPAAPAAVTSMTGMTSAHQAHMASDASHDDHAHTAAAAPGVAVPGTDSSTGSGHGMGGELGSMVMLCVVMLASAALTLLALLVVGIVRPLLPAAFRPAGVRAHASQWVRGTGPPPEWQFSVIRC